ncbi:MAG TPA: hypothetical protein VFE85_03605 [Woeseiaceae bacterium]|nr:hypothetical protein [Woeseiaceae bacterium]
METTMNRFFRHAVPALLLSGLSLSALAQGRPQVINIPLTRPGDPIHLEISILSAHIEVIGEDREDAQFEVSVAGGERKIITPSGARAIKGGSYAFEIEEDDNDIDFDTDWRADKVTVRARIPRRADVELQTVNDGEIIVDNITGNLELSNTNGPITATNISGSVIAESVNDAIDVGFSRIDDVNVSSFESLNGDLSLHLPANAGAQLHLDSAQGEIYSDFEVDIVPGEGTVSREDGENGVAVRIENVIVANVNGGGPVLRLKTLHGDIHIRKLP